jgi:hypothetical protein
MNRLRLHVIACPVFQRELEMLSASAAAAITMQHLEMGLHERSADQLRTALQDAIDRVTADQCDAIVVAYGLCNRGIVGLQARSLPVVLPRAHDCIGMLLGDTKRYLAQMEAQAGTCFQSAGWLENAPANGDVCPPNLSFGPGSSVTRERLAKKYGEENADFLLEQFAAFTRHSQRLAFISTPVHDAARWEKAARKTAQAHAWAFEKLPGDLGWLRRLISAEWNEREFLILKPGERAAARHNGQLIGAEPA